MLLVLFSPYVVGFMVKLTSQAPFLAIRTGSMEPEISTGDFVQTKKVNPEDLQIGMIIAFDAHGLWDGAPEYLIVHRIVDNFEEQGIIYFITQGDANTRPDDAPIPQDRIVGRFWFKIQFFGWILIPLEDLNILGLNLITLILYGLPTIAIINFLIAIIKKREEKEEKKITFAVFSLIF